jgi:hypothetical protein
MLDKFLLQILLQKVLYFLEIVLGVVVERGVSESIWPLWVINYNFMVI